MPVRSVLVLGNARSGTSMTAGMLSILGVEMHESKKISKHPEQNPKGAFENVNFASITSNMHKDMTNAMPPRKIREKYDSRIKDLISIHERPLWGFKSAVTHHFLSMILPKLKNPHLVIVFRSLLPNAQSWMVHMKDVYGKKVEIAAALENMAKSQVSLVREVNFAKCPKLFTTYESIRANPWKQAQRMGSFLKVDPEPKKEEILDFIMPEYTTLKQ